ncbi:FkbM family methyltransferase [Mongoliitalea daihaiensis]|uniref:FkbM family methyltransferase n=1 Tax=Mongoliitalea daihaiensis TaxID=2782006 RepID=UPI001F429DF1|nr:FkbM family methyltransferase [Mongoliitalea daihaiensis]UJP66657.1 FkbM family methyltransferase [Mongoliitalea daihaiensis]
MGRIKHFFKKRYNQFRFNLCANENLFYLGFYKYFYSPPKNTLAEFLDQYSKKYAPITFIQIGANDGFIYDPIQKFIKRDGWRGIMLEPQPDVYAGWLTKIHHQRPEIQTINAALAPVSGSMELFTISFSSDRWATGLSSFDKSVLQRKIEDGTIQKKAKKAGVVLPKHKESWIAPRVISTITAKQLLSMLGETPLNLLVIDTEGYDFEILKMIDLSQVKPEVIVYEDEHFDEETRAICVAYLENNGYENHYVGRDAYAIKVGFQL